MKLDPSPGFNRDIRRIRDADLRRRVTQTIEELRSASSLADVSGVVRVRAARGRHYRIRVGTYRLGIELEGDVVSLSRFLHRREFYRHFP